MSDRALSKIAQNSADEASFVSPDVLEQLMGAQLALELDERINVKLERMGQQLAQALVELGADLARMKISRGYFQLGYRSWETYLETKRTYGRTYLSYILKLGQAGDLATCLELGMSGAQLVEYAKHCDFPAKLPQLIEATWEEVSGKSVRESRVFLNEYVQEHHEDYKKPGRREVLLVKAPTQKWRQSFRRQFSRLSEAERAAYLAEMEAFLLESREVGETTGAERACVK